MIHSNGNPRVILGSQSAARRSLLEGAGFEVRVVEPEVEELPVDATRSAEETVHRNAWRKAQAVAARIETGLIITADTAVRVEGEILGKPRDRADAERMLRLHSERPLEVLTGLCLCRGTDRVCLSTVETTTLFLSRLGGQEMENYLENGPWRETSGAYAIDGPEDPLIEWIDGSLSNAIGLPLERLSELLEAFPSLLVP